MSTWIWSGYAALYIGGVLVALLLVPLLVVQHRRYGRLSPARLVGSALVTVYLVALVTYTWLPLPPRSEAWCAQHGVDGMNWQPLRFVGTVQEAIATQGLGGALSSVAVLQVVFNVLLFVPWGVIVAGFLHRSVATAAGSGFVASVVIEATQGTGLWFLYPCAYRFADVDDVLTNSLGALIGALLAPAIVWWLPRSRALAADRLSPRPVTVWRRWTGMAVDLFAVWAISTVVTVLYRTARLLLGAAPSGPRDDLWLVPSVLLPMVLVFWLPAWHGGAGGSGSAGHNAVWLTPVWRDRPRDGTRGQRLVRATVVPGPWLVAALLPDGPAQLMLVLAGIWALLAVVLVPFTRGGRSLGGLVTRTDIVDLRGGDGGDGTGPARSSTLAGPA